MEEARLSISQRRDLSLRMMSEAPLPQRVKSAPSTGNQNLFDMKRNYYFSKRKIEQIKNAGAYEPEVYRPPQCRGDRSHEKVDLQEIMTYGKKIRHKEPKIRKVPRVLTKQMRLEELSRDIEERAKFLYDMTALGQKAKYENIIKQEVAAKLREMDQVLKMKNFEFDLL